MRRTQKDRTGGIMPKIAALALLGGAMPQAATATMTSPAQICDRVAAIAAEQSGVPMAVLRAISLTETGRVQNKALRPWPWTINMEGEGHWFDSVDEARAYVFKEFKRGARSFDVGCFQINYKWHGDAFASIDQMFDPVANATYAAGLLRDLHAETGSWSKAAGAYHSRTPAYATRYRERFDRILAGLEGGGLDGGDAGTQEGYAGAADIPEIPDIVAALADSPVEAPVPRVNTFPLLVAGASSGLGSLVPVAMAPGASLFPASASAAMAATEEPLP